MSVPSYAGRSFDGANDEIEFGSDASIDDFQTRVLCAWFSFGASGALQALYTKGAAGAEIGLSTAGNLFRYASDWTTDGSWIGTNTITGAGFKYLCITYSNTGTANDPVLTVDCNQETLTTDTNPTGTWTADAANNLQIGETNADAADFNGVITGFIYDSGTLNAANCNRARFWGRHKGGIVVYHPFWTTKLTNEGTGTANGTATGTTMTSSPIPTVRPGQAMLGDGTGW